MPRKACTHKGLNLLVKCRFMTTVPIETAEDPINPVKLNQRNWNHLHLFDCFPLPVSIISILSGSVADTGKADKLNHPSSMKQRQRATSRLYTESTAPHISPSRPNKRSDKTESFDLGFGIEGESRLGFGFRFNSAYKLSSKSFILKCWKFHKT